jgi:hypothetical protein
MSELSLDDYDPDEGAALVNESLADDDADDPYLESYQHYGNSHERVANEKPG